jgi:hypothetical protein
MKFEQDDPVFPAVHIVLETQEEADAFYHMMNCSWYSSMEEYFKSAHDGVEKKMRAVAMQMWHAMGRKYRPSNEW